MRKIKYKAKECRCWVNYPNEAHKKKNGEWKCEQYKCVLQGDGLKRKTRCVLKDEKDNSDDFTDYPGYPDQFDNLTGSMNL